MVVIESEKWQEENECEEAEKHVGSPSVNATGIESLMKKGRALYEAQDFEAAKTNFQEAVKKGEVANLSKYLLLPAMNNVAACSLRLGDHEGVLASTEHVLEVLEIDSPKALLRRWLSLVHLGEMVEADQTELHLQGLPLNDDMRRSLDAHKKAIAAEEERQKRNIRCSNLRVQGNSKMRDHHVDHAVELYTAALAEDPFDVPTSNNRAQAYLILGRFEDAEKDATVALQTEPYNTKAAYRRAKARLKLPQPDKGGACADLARVLSSNPKAQEAKDILAQTVEEMGLDSAGVVIGEEIRSNCTPVQIQHSGGEDASPNDETESGYGTPMSAENIHQDKEISLEPKQSLPIQAERQPGAKKHPSSLMIVEDDCDGDGCSWCPVVAEEQGKGGHVSEEYWSKGEEHRINKDWAGAVEAFTRGTVADPSSAACWTDLNRVHREQHSYGETSEAASRAHKVAPISPSALLCSALMPLGADTECTEEQLVYFVQNVQEKLNNMDMTDTNKAAKHVDITYQ